MEYEIPEVIVAYIKNHFEPCMNVGDRIYYEASPDFPNPATSCLITHLDLYYQYELKEDPLRINKYYYEILKVNCHRIV